MLKKFLIGTVVALALLVGTYASAADFGSTTLKVGSKGEAVKAVQTLVGATPIDGVFGPMTKAKVIAWQASNGLVADGLFGTNSKAKAANGTSVVGGTTLPAGCIAGALFSSTTGASCASVVVTLPAGCTAGAAFSSTTGAACVAGTTPVVPGVLTGGAGDISTSTVATDIENRIVEGQSDIKNLGFKVEAVDSDIQVTNMKITMTQHATGSSYLDRYVGNVSVWMNGSKVATVSGSDFNKDSSGIYSKSIALANAVIREGSSNKATFYVTTTGLSNIDTADMGGNWTMKIDNIRFTDGTGAILTDNTSLTSNALVVSSISSTGDVKVAVSKGSATPVAGSVEVSSTGSTSGVLMLEVKMKNTGADMTFDTMKFDLTSDASPLSNVLGELILKEGSNELASLSTFSTSLATEQVTFNLNDTYTLNEGDTKYFRVYATINDSDNFAAGNGLIVSYTAKSANLEIANTRTSFTTETGSAIGENQSFYSSGAVVKFVSDAYTAPDTTASQEGTISLTFTVTAFGDNDVVINKDATTVAINGGEAVVTSVTGGTPSGSIVTQSGATADASGNFTVSAGDTKTFTISKKLPSVSGFVSMKITAVGANTISNVTTRSF